MVTTMVVCLVLSYVTAGFSLYVANFPFHYRRQLAKYNEECPHMSQEWRERWAKEMVVPDVTFLSAIWFAYPFYYLCVAINDHLED